MTGSDRRPLAFATRAIHPLVDPKPIASTPIAPPIVQTASFSFPETNLVAGALKAQETGYVYSRLQNPTAELMERAVASLEEAEEGVAFASGMAAVHGVLGALCSAGDHVVAPASVYGGTFALLSNVFARFGVTTTFVEPGNVEAYAAALRSNTRIVYAETIANPTLAVVDLARLATVAAEGGATLVVDSTFASPWLCRPLSLGAEVVLHSASKYLGGHGDLIGGVAVGDRELMKRIRHTSGDLGGAIAPFVAWLVLRGLKTLALRMERHCESAALIANFLANHPCVERVSYPGLASHPHHEVARGQLHHGFGGMIAFEVRGGRPGGARFMDHLELIARATSLGDASSLALQPATTSHRQLNADQLEEAGISEGFVRLSVGLEDPNDLIADLDRALSA